MTAQMRGRSLALPIHNFGVGKGVGEHCLTLAILDPERRPSAHCTGDWVGLGASLVGYKKSLPHQGINPGLSSS